MWWHVVWWMCTAYWRYVHPKLHCFTCQKNIISVMKLKRNIVSVGQSIGGYLQCCRIDEKRQARTFHSKVGWSDCLVTLSFWQQNFAPYAVGIYAPIVPTKILRDPDELERHLLQNGSVETCKSPTPTVDTHDKNFIFSQQDSEIELHVSCTET